MAKTLETIYITVLAVLVAIWFFFVGTLEPIHQDRRATKAASTMLKLEEIRDGSQNGIHRH